MLLGNMTASAATWERVAPLPEGNGGFICGTHGRQLMIAGGTTWREGTKHWLHRIWLFDPERNTWRDAGQLTEPLGYAASGQTSAGLHFAGGSTGKKTRATLSRLDATLTEKQVASLDARFVYAASAVLGDTLYVIGGAPVQDRLEAMTSACFAIDCRDGRVTRLVDLPVPGFATGTAAACGGRVFVFGGARWDGVAGAVENMAGTFAWSPQDQRWSALADYPFAARGITAVTLDARYIYIAGGYKNDAAGFTDEAFLFDAKSGTFQPAGPLPLRAMVGLVVSGEHLYCLGGEDRKQHRSEAAWRIRVADLLPR